KRTVRHVEADIVQGDKVAEAFRQVANRDAHADSPSGCGRLVPSSFPNSVWERTSAKLCFAHRGGVLTAPRNGSFAERRSQTGVWERGGGLVRLRTVMLIAAAP